MDGQRKPGSTALIGALFLLFAIATVTGFLGLKWHLAVASEHGKGVDDMIEFLLVATGVMFVFGHGILAYFVWRFGGRGASYRPMSAKSEWLTTLIPIVVVAAVAEGGVLAIGMPVWAQIFGHDPDAVQVEVVGKQFEWIVRYPGRDGKYGRVDPKLIDDENLLGLDRSDPASKDDIVIRGALTLPAGRTASIRVRSMDVLHSFTIPLFRTKQDAVPGTPMRTQVKPTVPGRYEITCAELCGLGHYRMRAFCTVMTAPEFEKWLAGQSGFFE
jgi:cytochrome c oxidase subunit 2